MGSICGATALLRVLSFSNSMQYNRQSSKGVNGAVSEEVVERAIHLVHSFLNTNVIAASRSTAMKEESSGKTKGKNNKESSEVFHRKLVADVCKAVFPVISSFVSALECLLSCSKQSDRISIGAYELGFLLLKVDPATNAFAEQFNSIAANLLVSTQKTAISMLRVLFVGYPAHRQEMLVANLSLLSVVYSAKNPSKLYPLHFSGQTIGDSGRHASVSFIALLTCLQSVVNVSDGLSASSHIGEGSCELSNESLKNCKNLCSKFATELMMRCTHKEASAEYRNVANCILNELFAAALLPSWPICSILLEHFTLRVINQLNKTSQDGKQTADGGSKRDNALVVFLLDLLGTIALGLRKVVLVVDREVECANSKQLAAVVKEAVRQKIDSMKPTWLTYLTKPVVSSSAAEKPKEKKGSKKGGKSTSPDRSESAEECLIETNKALAILAEISSFTVDAVAEQPMHGEVVTTSSLLALVPPPLVILEQVGGQEDLISKLPVFAAADLHYVHIYNHLSQLCEGAGRQSRHKSNSMSSDEVSLPESSADDFLRDARDITLTMWHQHADCQRRSPVSAHVLKLLNQAVGVTCDRESKARGDAYFYSAKEEYAWRGNYSLESILGNIRYVLNEGLLYSLFNKVLETLLRSLEDTAPAIRAKVLKLMTVLLQHDAELIRTDEIRRAITLRLEDRAISVREEAVKLVGGYIVRGIDLGGEDYLEGLKLRLSADDGISVRKSVVNIFREILLNQPNHPQYITLCLLLLKQGSAVKEEDSIKDIVRMTFQTIWFLPPSVSAAQSNLKLSASNVTLSASSSHVVEADSFLEMAATSGDVLSPSAVVTPSRKRGLDGISRAGFSFETPTKSRLQMLPSGWTQQPKTPSVASSEGSSDPGNFLRTIPEGDVNNYYFVAPDGQRFDTFEQAALACGLSNPEVPPSPSHSVTYSVPNTPSGRNQRVKNSIALGLHVDSTATQLVDMISQDVAVSRAGSSVHDWIISLLREVLHNKTNGDEGNTVAKQRRSASHLHVEKIVSSLVELLLRTEENDQQVARYLVERNRGDRRDYIVNIIVTIALLCEAHPPFIAKHLKTLLPYLKGDSNHSAPQSSLICLKVTGILSSTALLERSALQSMNVSDVITDLTKIAKCTIPENISAAINCLAVLVANVTYDAEPLFQLAKSMFDACVRFRKAFANAYEMEGMIRAGPMLQIPVMVLGFVCEHLKKCSKAFETYIARFSSGQNDVGSLQLNTIFNSANADDELVKRCDLLDITYLHPRAIFGAAFVAVAYTLTVPVVALQAASAQALCGVFIGHPRLMLACQDSGLLVRLLGGGSGNERFHELVNQRFVEALRDMMSAEETRLEQQAALSLMKESGTAILPSGVTVHKTVLGPVEAESDSSITGFVLQQHLPMLCVFLSSESDSLRSASLKLVGTLLRQGMLCPLDVMGPLVAFQGDPDKSVREESLRVIQIEDSRHPTFLDNRLLEGVESTVGFQVRTLGRPSATICVDNGEEMFAGSNAANRSILSVFSALYLSCIQGNKKRKIDFLYGLLRRSNNIFVGVHETFAKCASSFESHFITEAQAMASVAAAALQLQMEQDAANGVESVANRSGPLTPSRMKPPSRALVRSSSTGSRSSLDSSSSQNELTRLVSAVSEATHKLLVVDFMSLTLAYLPYESLSDPLHAIYWINRNCVLSASAAVERLRQCLLLVGAEMRVNSMQPPAAGSKPNTPLAAKKKGSHAHHESESDLLLNEQVFLEWYNSSSANGEARFSVAVRLLEIAHQAMEVRSKEAALRLKYFLKSVYSLSDERCVSFNPEEKAVVAGTSSTVDKVVLMETDMTYSSSSVGAADYASIFTPACLSQLSRPSGPNAEHALSVIRAVVADHNRISILLHSDPDDFTLVSGAAVSGGAVKRKRATKNADNDDGSVTSAGKTPKSAKKARTPSKTAMSGGGGSAKKRSKGKARLSDSDEDPDFYSDEDSVLSGASSAKGKSGGARASVGGAVSVRAKRATAARKSINYVDENEDVDEPPPGMDM
eukprot:gene21271-27294_t